MIIGKSFVLGHPGKTGGDAILQLCRHLSPLHQLIVDSPEDGRKHHFFHRREAEEPGLDLESKDRLLSFRRLEFWLASYHAHFQRQQGLPVDREKYARGLIPFFKLNRKNNHWSYEPGDALLKEYLDRPVAGYIRMEHLKADLLLQFRRYLNLSVEEENAISGDPYFKKSPAIPGWDVQLTPVEKKIIRQNNPLWTELEATLYPNVREE